MNRALLLLCTTIALAAFLGCTAHHHHPKRTTPTPVVVHVPAPPPHAPAHGYRHKHHHHGVELVFDSHQGVYTVVGRNNVFFHHDHFYRIADGGWQISTRVDRGWAHVHSGKLPRGLAKKAVGAKRHHKKHHPAKHHPGKRRR